MYPFSLIVFPSVSDGKEYACNAGDLCLIPGSGRSPEEGNGNPLQYSCLENPMDKRVWWATIHGVTVSDMIEWLAYILSQTPLPSRLLHNNEHSSMCYTIGSCWFSILVIATTFHEIQNWAFGVLPKIHCQIQDHLGFLLDDTTDWVTLTV